MDIVERLAQWAENDMRAEEVALKAKYEIERLRKGREIISDALKEAADEIEKLREALRKIENIGDCGCQSECGDMIAIALAALKGDE